MFLTRSGCGAAAWRRPACGLIRPSLLRAPACAHRLCTKSEAGDGVKPPPLPPFLDESLRGVGQVVFCNDPRSGAVMLAALLYGDVWLGAMGARGFGPASAREVTAANST